MSGESKNAGGESKSGAAPRVPSYRTTLDRYRIAQSTPAQQRAIARGRTVGQAGDRRNVPIYGDGDSYFTLRQRAMYPDESKSPAGDALYYARTKGVMRGIGESFRARQQTGEIARAMGRQNLSVQYLKGKRLGSKKKGSSTVTAPWVLTPKIATFTQAHNVSDLTKTLSGAPTRRRGRFAARRKVFDPVDARLKTPSKGGRRTRKRKFKRKRKRKRKTRKTRHKSKRSSTRSRRIICGCWGHD